MPKIDAIVYWPPTDKAYFFRGSDYVRYRLSGGEKAEEKVSLREHRWKGLAFEDRIDAAATVEPQGAVYFFREDKFVPYRISDSPDEEGALDEPRPIVERFSFLPPKYQSNLDAVLYWPNNGRLYFFKEDCYLACEPGRGTPLQPERPLPGGWTDLPFDRIDTAFVGKHGKGYFFRGEEYVAYSVSQDKAVGPAQPWKDHWPAQRSNPDEKTLWELLSEGGETDVSAIPDETATSDAPRNLIVGFNYPWAWDAFGEYLAGVHPPGSVPAMDDWIKHLRTNLQILKNDLNIWHVRIFLLCNAWNYGSLFPTSTPAVTLPATLPPKYADHLKEMLNVFAAEDMMVIPSLISFEAFWPLGRFSSGMGGRADLANDVTLRGAFLTQVLDGFLSISGAYRSSIFAWEVINEPIWDTSPAHASVLASLQAGALRLVHTADVSHSAMSDFIDDALQRIDRENFDSTVGHRYYSDLSTFPTGKWRQFHYYPDTIVGVPGLPTLPYADPPTIPDYATSQAFIGAFACKLPGQRQGGAWPELGGADTIDVATTAYERLRLLNRKGYGLALVSPDDVGAVCCGPDPLKLSKDAKDGIKRFMASP